jgi:hypothetical protein
MSERVRLKKKDVRELCPSSYSTFNELAVQKGTNTTGELM